MVSQRITSQQVTDIPYTHFILVLDSSGSMSQVDLNRPGNKWDNLKNSITLFLNELINVKMRAKLSLVIYDEKSFIIFKDQDPSFDLISQVQYTGFGTNFIKPMEDAYDIATSTMDNYEEVVVFFLSDGSALYPDAAIRSFTQNNILMNKI